MLTITFLMKWQGPLVRGEIFRGAMRERWLQCSDWPQYPSSVVASPRSFGRTGGCMDPASSSSWRHRSSRQYPRIRRKTHYGCFNCAGLAELVAIWDLLEQLQLEPGTADIFAWRLTADQRYSASSAYGAMFIGSSRSLGAKQIWKTAAPPRVRFFFWLIMHERCWTAERRCRHGL